MDIKTTSSRQASQYDRKVHTSTDHSSAVRSTKNTTNMFARPWFCSIALVLYLTLSSSATPIREQEITALLKEYTFTYTRRVRIYSRTSRRHLRVVGNQLDCKGRLNDPSAVMVLESVNLKGHIRIKSERENSYVCVNDGKLVLEPNKLARCLFVEDYSRGYTMFKSVFNSSWFLGSKRSGVIKQPRLTNRTQTAVLFLVEKLS